MWQRHRELTTLGPVLQPQKSAGESLELTPKDLRNEAKEKNPKLPVPMGCPIYWILFQPPSTWVGGGIATTESSREHLGRYRNNPVRTPGVFVRTQVLLAGKGERTQKNCFNKQYFIH